MAYDEALAQRIREVMHDYSGVSEKKMFGGIAFMIDGNMCAGVVDSKLMLRVGPDQYEICLKQKYAHEMDFTGRPMKGFIYVQKAGIESDKSLRRWLAIAYEFAGALPKK